MSPEALPAGSVAAAGGDERLPCRGCTIACENYARCNGTPWRLTQQLAQSAAWAGLFRAADSEPGTARAFS